MTKENVYIDSLALAGYRSFGKEIQRFEKFNKINLFIGQNNSGKSNILRFIHEKYLSTLHQAIKLDALDKHMTSNTKFIFGFSISTDKDNDGNYVGLEYINFRKLPIQSSSFDSIYKVLKEKGILDKTDDTWFIFDQELKLILDNWEEAFSTLGDRALSLVWNNLTGQRQGGRKQHWYPETLRNITPQFKKINSVLIPAIRQIGSKGSVSEDFSGKGIIERLVKLQNPDVHNQNDRKKFDKINSFLRNVTGNETAEIEIPHERDTILVHMDDKTLPLESLGTGIHEVIILASAATILENFVICMEEPELHLNPILQKKLVRYLSESTNNQYFITTHSAALMDTPTAEVYQVSLIDGESIISRVTSDKHRSEVCEELGYHPSDLLQSNCIIWVEGPSDRIYLNYWIHKTSPELIEGVHYSIMFYGGRLASHLTGKDISEDIENFISLRRLNRRGVIVIDSDRDKKSARINSTKKRLRDEFDEGPGFAWITQGREIENYLPSDNIKEAINATIPSSKINSTLGQFENTLSIIRKNGKEAQASKVDVAKYIAEKYDVDLTILDLNKNINKLVTFIKESNPSINITE
ncbi:ATP-dependent nuclease [Sulfurovum sp. CS9]|uniref:ATP-dependent nuclease n=1 Tax=Sulfurovum sp. CS9 TaxID=3391146 RepID=UPI0039ECE939